MDEYAQIRNMLGKVRLIQESVPGAPTMGSAGSTTPTPEPAPVENRIEAQNQSQASSGEKFNFDDIKTVGILNAQGLSDNVKNTVKSTIGEFIKNTGLILDTANITVQDNRVVITSDTIKNPNISTIQSITFDTNEDSPTAQVVSGTVEISSDLITLFQSIMLTYNDNQIGRNGLITATQGKM